MKLPFSVVWGGILDDTALRSGGDAMTVSVGYGSTNGNREVDEGRWLGGR
jgi:hypothetical protein